MFGAFAYAAPEHGDDLAAYELIDVGVIQRGLGIGRIRMGWGCPSAGQAQQDSFETSVVKALATIRIPSAMVR
ncbi:hypothetical protein GCM10007231_25800 [Nocardioides daphniae]|uniref:Uncharacterized protein n=1 Tax=Nocardioides daphniae TaxID=402297 RepID=A0ABQ1QFZ7_9ACTN|nr:hypothetical protein GCM10007231_25800 [Nocardioides daphniae]